MCGIDESNYVTIMTLEELHSKLLVHERRMKGHKEEEHALKVTYGGRSEGRNRGRGCGRGKGRQSNNKEHMECYKCHKLGHFQYECPSWEENANFAEFDEEEMLLMAIGEETKSEEMSGLWFLDSGCSNHMCGKKNWFYNLDETFCDFVKLGNGSRLVVKGKGSVKLRIEGRVHIISNVFYIPKLKNNLLSIGKLQQKNLAVVFMDDRCKVYHKEKGLIITSVMRNNRMFIITGHVETILPSCLKTT